MFVHTRKARAAVAATRLARRAACPIALSVSQQRGAPHYYHCRGRTSPTPPQAASGHAQLFAGRSRSPRQRTVSLSARERARARRRGTSRRAMASGMFRRSGQLLRQCSCTWQGRARRCKTRSTAHPHPPHGPRSTRARGPVRARAQRRRARRAVCRAAAMPPPRPAGKRRAQRHAASCPPARHAVPRRAWAQCFALGEQPETCCGGLCEIGPVLQVVGVCGDLVRRRSTAV